MSVRAVILAAGRGSRLGGLTADRPKVLVEVAGATVLTHQRRALDRAGIRDVHLVAGHAVDHVRAHPDVRGLRVHVNPDWAATNMVATLSHAGEALAGDADVVVAYGDIVYEPRLLAALEEVRDADVGVVVDLDWEAYWRARMEDPLSDVETLRLGPTGRLLEIGAPARRLEDVEAQYVGLLRIRADAVGPILAAWAALPGDHRVRGRTREELFMTDLLQLLVDDGRDVRAAPVRAGWLEFDAPEDLALAGSGRWTAEPAT